MHRAAAAGCQPTTEAGFPQLVALDPPAAIGRLLLKMFLTLGTTLLHVAHMPHVCEEVMHAGPQDTFVRFLPATVHDPI